MSVIITILIPIALSAFFVFIAKKINVPPVVALIASGILIGLPSVSKLVIGNNYLLINVLGDIGIFALMFVAGLDTSWKNFLKERKDSAFIAFFAFLTPFILGFTASYFILKLPLASSFIIGIVISITAEATKAKVLIDLKALRTRMGSALMGAGIIDDLIGVGLFSLVIIFWGGASLAENFITLGIIGAFFLGIFFQRFIGISHFFTKICKNVSLGIVVPFFFVSMGMNFELSSIFVSSSLIFIILILGFSGKMAGTFIAKHFVNFSWKQLYVVGWAMNSRGAVEIVFALIAFEQGFISQNVYSSLIILALTTTLIFPFVITSIVRKSRSILR